jgi:hypothetical protein
MANSSKMLRLILSAVVLIILGCDSKPKEGPEDIKEKSELIQKEKEVTQEKPFVSHEQVVLKLISSMKSGQNIGFLMSDKIKFIYHSDNRCDGSTGGFIDDLPGISIDKTIKIQVTNSGDGWACKKRKSTTYQLDFKLSEYLKLWDRFESGGYDEKSNSTYIYGFGQSDYIILGFEQVRGQYQINKFEYRSEDPG